MSVLNKDDLLKKISEKVENEDIAIELMEDVSDSYNTDIDTIKSEYEEKITGLSTELEDVKKKYKERFTDGNFKEVQKEDKREELEEKKVIDIREI